MLLGVARMAVAGRGHTSPLPTGIQAHHLSLPSHHPLCPRPLHRNSPASHPHTDYGGPSTLSNTYDGARGQGSFGILAWGSCGYTNGDGSLAFAPVRGLVLS